MMMKMEKVIKYYVQIKFVIYTQGMKIGSAIRHYNVIARGKK